MKKSIFAGFMLLALTAAGKEVTFPLEWNRTYDTAVPYEVEIDRKRLAEISGTAEDTGFEVIAISGDKRTPLKTALCKGALKNTTSLRFTVPAGTTALECKASGKGVLAETAEAENLFAGAVSKNAVPKWKSNNAITVSATENGVFFHCKRYGEFSAWYEVDVPAGMAGKPVRLELDVKSHTPIPWSNINMIEQLDANGKVLPEGAVRPDWISHMRPCGVLTQMRENGRLRPDVKKLRFKLRMRNIKRAVGLDGKTLKNFADCEAKLEISRLVLRSGAELPFPKYADRFFGDGVSGKPGDHSLRLSDGDAFFYPVGSQAVWGDTKQVRDPYELYFPIGDGTVEFFLKPDDWKYVAPGSYVVLMDSYNSHGMRGWKNAPVRKEIFELRKEGIELPLSALSVEDCAEAVYKAFAN